MSDDKANAKKKEADILLRRLNAIDTPPDPEVFSDPETAAAEEVDKHGAAKGFSAASHLVSGILVGMALGYGLQMLLPIKPWGMAIMIPVGFAAGMLNMIRSLEK